MQTITSVKTLARSLCLSLAAALLLATTGCQTVSVTSTQEIGGPTFPPTDPATVEILRTEPTRPHVRLGEVRAEPSDEEVSASKIEDALRKAAAKLGANAAVVVYDRTQVTGAYVTGPWYGRSIEQIQSRVVIAVAIRYQ
ncbi:MAG TPA: hypothetical protein VFZ59_05605 [Verrucomicrobiae bacterium]|nr:hypothetical protein [Verrucomicrobiae bacterium]